MGTERLEKAKEIHEQEKKPPKEGGENKMISMKKSDDWADNTPSDRVRRFPGRPVLIGYLWEADMDTDGNGFGSSWKKKKNLKTDRVQGRI